MDANSVWPIVLAAGEGRRVAGLTTAGGSAVPKQFCSFGRGRSMLQWALDRARSIAPIEHVVTVVAREHENMWKRELTELPRANIVVQPRNCGTAAGILLPLAEVLRRDEDAVVVVLPSDHHVEDEGTFVASIERAIEAVEEDPGQIVLLGITPDDEDSEYGWILPASSRRRGGIYGVERFVEKPRHEVAAELRRNGAVWNCFTFVATARGLLRLYDKTLPGLLDAFHPMLSGADRCPDRVANEIYEGLVPRDFSREALERDAGRLAVLVVPTCGWMDLGTPPRLQRFLHAVHPDGRAPLTA